MGKLAQKARIHKIENGIYLIESEHTEEQMILHIEVRGDFDEQTMLKDAHNRILKYDWYVAPIAGDADFHPTELVWSQDGTHLEEDGNVSFSLELLQNVSQEPEPAHGVGSQRQKRPFLLVPLMLGVGCIWLGWLWRKLRESSRKSKGDS